VELLVPMPGGCRKSDDARERCGREHEPEPHAGVTGTHRL
jgi:hypothetical protein